MRQEDRIRPLTIVWFVRSESAVFVWSPGAFLVGSTLFGIHFRVVPLEGLENCATRSQRARDLGKFGIQESDIETRGGVASLSVWKILSFRSLKDQSEEVSAELDGEWRE